MQAAAEMACNSVRRASLHPYLVRQLFSVMSKDHAVAGSGAVGESRFTRGFSSDSALQIKALRERTGAPIKDVKAALLQCGWDAGLFCERDGVLS